MYKEEIFLYNTHSFVWLEKETQVDTRRAGAPHSTRRVTFSQVEVYPTFGCMNSACFIFLPSSWVFISSWKKDRKWTRIARAKVLMTSRRLRISPPLVWNIIIVQSINHYNLYCLQTEALFTSVRFFSISSYDENHTHIQRLVADISYWPQWFINAPTAFAHLLPLSSFSVLQPNVFSLRNRTC
jgi:hypothetical protein